MLSRVGRWLQTPQAEEWEYLSRPSTEYKLVLRHMLVVRGLNELADYDRRIFEQPTYARSR